jgi:hypothetical protein
VAIGLHPLAAARRGPIRVLTAWENRAATMRPSEATDDASEATDDAPEATNVHNGIDDIGGR